MYTCTPNNHFLLSNNWINNVHSWISTQREMKHRVEETIWNKKRNKKKNISRPTNSNNNNNKTKNLKKRTHEQQRVYALEHFSVHLLNSHNIITRQVFCWTNKYTVVVQSAHAQRWPTHSASCSSVKFGSRNIISKKKKEAKQTKIKFIILCDSWNEI